MNVEDFKAHLIWAEGRKNDLYDDATGKSIELRTGGKITGGVGWNFTDNGIPDEVVEILLNIAVERAMLAATALPYFHMLDPVRQLCVADLIFNLGPYRWAQFARANDALARLEYGRAAIELQDSKWFTQTGRRARRIVEAMRTGIWTHSP